ncbi:hypothetical protein C7N43_17150 [Sphingobacteriales bacterium UPWRP_1]|nr:hypothetical protein BVG80_12980 [Sphingobacteriales bacterium TSM_CSM]PSJ75799.1 hypothetical protein C7N43_17150 [Sphingobacteriales bacterium UPWRP_1]
MKGKGFNLMPQRYGNLPATIVLQPTNAVMPLLKARQLIPCLRVYLNPEMPEYPLFFVPYTPETICC